MRIIFIVYRINSYRFFAPLIQKGLEKGYKIECWHVYGRQRNFGIKKHTFPHLEYMPQLQSGDNIAMGKIIHGDSGVDRELLTRNDIDIVVSIHPPHYYLGDELLKSLPFQWCTLFSSIDSYIELTKISQERLKYKFTDIFFVPSAVSLEEARQYLREFCPERSYLLDDKYRKICICGTIEFDMFEKVNQESVRRKYNIPKDKSIFLYLPFPYWNNSHWGNAFSGILMNTKKSKDGNYIHDKKNSFFANLLFKAKCLNKIFRNKDALRYFAKGLNEAKVFKAVRKFCDVNNLYLVVKPRLKYPVADFIKRKADLIVWDDERQQNPPILKELLAVARLASGFFSFSVLTSAFSGIYYLNIALPDGYFNYYPSEKFWYLLKEQSPHNFPGVCESWSIEKTINDLDRIPLGHFTVDPQQRLKYIKEYIGFDDFSSSERFYSSLESHLAKNKEELLKQ